MKINRFMIPILLLITILLSSCNLSASTTPSTATPQPGLNSNTLAQTIEALSTQSVSGQPTGAPVNTDTVVSTATEIATETETLEPTQAETLTDTPVPTQSGGIPVVPITPIATLSSYNPPYAITPISTCNIGTFEADVTIPNYSNLAPGSSFVKTWRILNSGTCTWDTGYQLFFSSGSSLSAPSAVNLPKTVAPGQTVDISVNMVAPTSSGVYQGSWLLRNDSVFGVGVNGNVPVNVLIVVGSTSIPSSGFAVTHIVMSVDTAASTVNCPPGHNFTFTGDIETNGAGTVTYYWDFSNGTKTAEKTLTFLSAGTQSVSTTWKLGTTGPESSNPFKGWVRVYIDAPNHQFFSKENITLTCNSSPSPSDTPTPTPTP